MDGNPFKVIKYGYCPVDFPTNPLSSSPCGAEFVTAFDPSIRIDDKTWTSSNASSTSTSPDMAERIRNMATPDLNKAGGFLPWEFLFGEDHNQTRLENPLSWRLSTVTPPNKKKCFF